MRAYEFINELYNVPIHDLSLGPDIHPEIRRQYGKDPDKRELGVQDILGGGAPRVDNRTVIPARWTKDIFSGKVPTSEKDITHAQRQISQQELADIKNTGYAIPPVTGTKFSDPDRPQKWWSPADSQGNQFGRKWNKGETTIRVPIEKLPKKRAADANDLEIKNTKTGEWQPLMLKDRDQ